LQLQKAKTWVKNSPDGMLAETAHVIEVALALCLPSPSLYERVLVEVLVSRL
jgi:hypothetical protein